MLSSRFIAIGGSTDCAACCGREIFLCTRSQRCRCSSAEAGNALTIASVLPVCECVFDTTCHACVRVRLPGVPLYATACHCVSATVYSKGDVCA